MESIIVRLVKFTMSFMESIIVHLVNSLQRASWNLLLFTWLTIYNKLHGIYYCSPD